MYNCLNMSNKPDFLYKLDECRNIMKYMFQLSFNYSQNNDFAIEAILDATHDSCKATLLNGNIKFFGGINYEKTDKPEPALDCMTEMHMFNSVWKKILNHHCLLATYDKLHDLLFSRSILTYYNLADYFKNYGFDDALQKGIFMFNNDQIIKNHSYKGKSCISSELWSISNSFNNGLGTLKNKFSSPKLKNFNYIGNMITKNESEKYCITANNLTLIRMLLNRSRKLSNITNLYDVTNKISSTKIRKYLSTVELLKREPFSVSKDEQLNMSLSDKLYYLYKLEQTFNFDLSNCLSQNITKLQNSLNQVLGDSFIISATSCTALPNIFSRNYLVQMAFDSYTSYRIVSNSSLYDQINKPDSIVEHIHRTDRFTYTHSILEQWQKRYKEFIDYLSTLVFPVYESYFFTLLYDCCLSEDDSVTTVLFTMYNNIRHHLCQPQIYSEILTLDKDIIKNANQKPLATSSPLEQKQIIKPEYNDSIFDYFILHQTLLSIYNNPSDPKPLFIDLEYMNNHFDHLAGSALSTCIASILRT